MTGSRLGLRDGLDSTTVLFLDFMDGALTDRAGAATLTTYGTPSRAYGMRGDAYHFELSGTTKSRFTLPALSLSGAFTIDFVYRDESTPGSNQGVCLSCMAENGGQKSAFKVQAYSGGLGLAVWDSSDVSDSVASLNWPVGSQVNALTSYPIWAAARAWYQPDTGSGGTLGLGLNGRTVGYKVTTLADLQTATLGTLQIGAAVNASINQQWIGSLACIKVRNVADTDTRTMATAMPRRRVSRRVVVPKNIELREDLHAATWTDDTAGGFAIAAADMTTGFALTSHSDIVSVTAKNDGAADRVYAEVGNVTDVDATADTWFFEHSTGTLYVNGDPADEDQLDVVVRAGVAETGIKRGTRYYRPIDQGGSLSRKMAQIDEQYPTDAGGNVGLARNRTEIPSAIWAEDGNVLWPGSRVFARRLFDGLPWAESRPVFAGIVDDHPAVDSDRATLRVVTDPARLFKSAISNGAVDRDTYPNAYQADLGHVLYSPMGWQLLRVPCYCIDERRQTVDGVANCYQYAFASLPQSRIKAFGKPSGYPVISPDLSAGTLWSTVAPASGPYTIDLDGFGDPSSPTSAGLTAVPFGDETDGYYKGVDILRYLLARLFSLPSSSFDATWTATAGRAERWLRTSEPIGDPGSFTAWLQRTLADLMVFLYVEPYTEAVPAAWACEDVVQADSADFTLTDADVLEINFPVADRKTVVKRVNASALAYKLDQAGNLREPEETGLDLPVERRYAGLISGPWNGGRRGIYDKDTVDDWLAAMAPLKQQVLRPFTATVSGRALGLAQMSKVSLAACSALPSGLGSAYRLDSVTVNDNGTVTISGFQEETLPADGTSAEPAREALGPQQRARFHWPGGQAVTATSWTRVGTLIHPFQGGFGPFYGTMAHHLVVRWKRTGGGANTDLQLRLYDRTNSQVIATITSGVGTTVATSDWTTFTTANIPAADADLEVQTICANGATGTIHDVTWWSEEVSGQSFTDPFPSTLIFGWGYAGGLTLSSNTVEVPLNAGMGIGAKLYYVKHPDGGLIGVPGNIVLPGERCRLTVHADGTGATNLWAGFALVGGSVYKGHLAEVTGGDAFYQPDGIYAEHASGVWPAQYHVVVSADDLGSAVFHSLGVEKLIPLPVR